MKGSIDVLKTKAINFFLILLIFSGLFVITNFQLRTENKERVQEVYTKGNHLVSLIALQPMATFEKEHDFFVRTLMEYSTKEGLAYCHIVDRSGATLVSFRLPQVNLAIKNDQNSSRVKAAGLVFSPFEFTDNDARLFDFSKPIFENGERAGTVNIGLMLEPLSLFTKERISLLGMLFFFITAVVIIFQYGILQAVKPLRGTVSKLVPKSSRRRTKNELARAFGIGSIDGMIKDFHVALVRLKKQLKKIEGNNKGLASQVGVVKYEKRQIVDILNTINYGIMIIDIQGCVVHINDYLLMHLGKTRRDMIDRPFEEVFSNSALVHFISQQGSLEQLRAQNHVELSLTELSETDVFSVTCTPLTGADNHSSGSLITFNNITTQKNAEKNTIAFVAHLSHEIMTPLTTIQSYSEMLMEGEIEDVETQKEFFNTINKETKRLSRLIKDLLNLSRIEMGSLTLSKDIVKSDSLFTDCLVSVQGSAKKKGIAIERHAPDNFPVFMGDKELLKGAIINILGNAVKYTPQKGVIDFGLRKEGGNIIFDISDTGYGMSQEDLDHIFDKFYRSSNPKVQDNQGTGLGLCIAAEIINLHGGRIDVKSELGKGTYFIISIPMEEYYIDD